MAGIPKKILGLPAPVVIVAGIAGAAYLYLRHSSVASGVQGAATGGGGGSRGRAGAAGRRGPAGKRGPAGRPGPVYCPPGYRKVGRRCIRIPCPPGTHRGAGGVCVRDHKHPAHKFMAPQGG